MLTMTPPETRQDEDNQVDETADAATNVMLTVSPTRLRERFRGVGRNLKRRYNDTPRDCKGFNLIELVIAVVVIAALSRMGFAAYTGVTDDARSTVLNQNIQTAAEELQSVLQLNPGLAGTGQLAALNAELTERTNFIWEIDDFLFLPEDDADIIRLQWVQQDGTGAETAVTGSGTSAVSGPSQGPKVRWLVDDRSAVRIHMKNNVDEWRCALVIVKPSRTALEAGFTGAAPVVPDATVAAQKAAELRGTWYDGGTTATDRGQRDCSPIDEGAQAPAVLTSGGGGTGGMTYDDSLPEDANTWVIYTPTTAELDPSSTAVAGRRTLHGAVSGLDSNE